jgi:hypothetical protein
MLRPGLPPRPPAVAGAAVPVLPVTPEMLAALAQAIAGGVKVVWYADRRVEFMSLSDLMRAYDWLLGQLGIPGAQPVRRGACFSKGLDTGYGFGGVEHQEQPGVDVLWSRGAPPDPLARDDVDWERATGPRG